MTQQMTNAETPIARVDDDHYWAVIFTSILPQSEEAYDRTAARMVELASSMPGFLGVESVRGANGVGITVSYWKDEKSIAGWKDQAEHRVAQATGKSRWYADYAIRVCRVERTTYSSS